MNISAAETAERVARYQRTRDLSAVWPDVSEKEFGAAQQAIARATAAVLAGDSPLPPHLAPLAAPARVVGIVAFVSGMAPLLGYWIERGRLAATAPVAKVLAEHLRHGRLRAAKLRVETERIVSALKDRGVTVTLLKGADTAYRYFPDPATRPITDIDLLVSPERVEQACGTLQALGFVENEAYGLPHRSDWSPPGATGEVQSLELNHADNPWKVDLHVTLDRGYPGVNIRFGMDGERVSAECGVRSAEQWNAEVGTRNAEHPRTEIREEGASDSVPTSAFRVPRLPGARVLSQPLHLAYVASHTSQDFATMQLIRLVELVYVIRKDLAGKQAAWDAFVDFVTARRIERFVYPSLELADRLVPGTVEPSVRRRLARAAPRLLRGIVERTDPGALIRFRPRWLSARFMWSATPREYLRDVAHLMWPHNSSGPVSVRQFVRRQGRRMVRAAEYLARSLTRS